MPTGKIGRDATSGRFISVIEAREASGDFDRRHDSRLAQWRAPSEAPPCGWFAEPGRVQGRPRSLSHSPDYPVGRARARSTVGRRS